MYRRSVPAGLAVFATILSGATSSIWKTKFQTTDDLVKSLEHNEGTVPVEDGGSLPSIGATVKVVTWSISHIGLERGTSRKTIVTMSTCPTIYARYLCLSPDAFMDGRSIE